MREGIKIISRILDLQLTIYGNLCSCRCETNSGRRLHIKINSIEMLNEMVAEIEKLKEIAEKTLNRITYY